MMNKRGQLFTILAILLIGLMFLSFEIFSYIHERGAVKTRVSTMDSFLHSIEKNLERQMYISGYRIIFLAENETFVTASYIDVDAFFNEAFFNGTVNNEVTDILLGATQDDILDSLNEKARKINVNITMQNISIDVSQTDPWHVKFTLSSYFIMKDRENLARWERQQNISGFIPIENFEDPLYIWGSGVLGISQIITPTIYEGNYTISNLNDHLDQGYYAANPDAPSFLGRLRGDLSPDENGIESFVNKDKFLAQGLPNYEKSSVDYIYFSSDNPSYESVAGMPPWFRIDVDHKPKYGL